jgi:hypothetical protein
VTELLQDTRWLLEKLAERCENAMGPSREIDRAIAKAIGKHESVHFTSSLGNARWIEGDAMLVFASEIGADGLPLVKLVMDTTTTPIVEYSGIARTLELAWCAASLRARGSRRP